MYLLRLLLFVYIRFICIITTFIRFCWFGLHVWMWVSEWGDASLCLCVCFDRFNEEIEQVKKTNCNNKTIDRTKQLLYWLVLIRASCDISFPVWVSLKNTSSIVLAYFNQQFTCCISSFYVCVSVCWFGLLLLLFVLFLYWYIMEEFELPWAIVSFHYFLFYFVLRVAVCVLVC